MVKCWQTDLVTRPAKDTHTTDTSYSCPSCSEGTKNITNSLQEAVNIKQKSENVK